MPPAYEPSAEPSWWLSETRPYTVPADQRPKRIVDSAMVGATVEKPTPTAP